MFGWRSRALSAVLLLVLIFGLAQMVPQSSTQTSAAISHKHTLKQGPLVPPPQTSKPLKPPPTDLPSFGKASRTTSVQRDITTNTTMDLKVLVIAADGNEADLPAIKQTLDYLGTPYTVYLAGKTPGSLTAGKLVDPTNSAHAFYQGVILTNGFLGYTPPGGSWQSALTTAEWTALWNFEIIFGIREVSWYTYPSPDYGFNWPTQALDTSTTPFTVPFTTAGKTMFGTYANTDTPVTIQYATTYLATPLDSSTQPLLADASGNALAAIRSYKDAGGNLQREVLALTFDSNPYLLHDLTLSYGVVNWVTKGLFLGQHQVSFLAQPDDILNNNDVWTPNLACGTPVDNTGTTYRISGSDFQTVINWQKTLQNQPTTPGFMVEWPFNGVGTTADFIASEGNPAGQFSPDTLTPAVKANQGEFKWISHTYDHENMNAMTYDAAFAEFQQNNKVAKSLGFGTYNKKTLVTPDISGLTNPNMLQAAYDFGVRYLVSDTSQPGYNNPSPNAGIANPLQPGILMIPRHPTNLYYNVTMPEQWLAEDNCLYPAGAYGHVDTYAQLLDRESNMLLTYLLRGDIDPLMFHQPNLRAYDGTHTLLGDLVQATLVKYNKVFTLPIASPTEETLGQQMSDRMTYNAASVKAQLVGANKLTLTAQAKTVVPVTGLITSCGACTAVPYGKQNITLVKMNAGESRTLTLSNVAPAPTPRVNLTKVSPATGPVAGGNTVTLTGASFQAGATVTFDTFPATNVTVVNATTITAIAPAHAAGPVIIAVTSGGEQASLANKYTYTATAASAGTAAVSDDELTPAPIPVPRSTTAPSVTGSGTGGPAPAPIPTGR